MAGGGGGGGYNVGHWFNFFQWKNVVLAYSYLTQLPLVSPYLSLVIFCRCIKK